MLTAAGSFTNIFVAKYAADGVLVWAKSAGSASSFSEGRGIATDPRGNSYVTGAFQETATFGADEPNQTVLTGEGHRDVFVAQYAPHGSLLWAKSAGGPEPVGTETGSDQGLGIAVDPRGNSYVTGLFQGTATFGAGEANEALITGAGGNSDIFVAKYTRDGTLVWATQAGGTDSDQGLGIATDIRGSSYITGAFRDTAKFGTGEANETVLTPIIYGWPPPPNSQPPVRDDIFVAKYAR